MEGNFSSNDTDGHGKTKGRHQTSSHCKTSYQTFWDCIYNRGNCRRTEIIDQSNWNNTKNTPESGGISQMNPPELGSVSFFSSFVAPAGGKG